MAIDKLDIEQIMLVSPDDHSPDIVEFEVPGTADMIASIRRCVVEFARSMPFTASEIDDIRLAVGEAATNALRHGANPDWRCVGVRMEKQAGRLKICIIDQGCGFDPRHIRQARPGSLTEGGRGIMFMKALMDEVNFKFTCPGTCVELIKNLSPV